MTFMAVTLGPSSDMDHLVDTATPEDPQTQGTRLPAPSRRSQSRHSAANAHRWADRYNARASGYSTTATGLRRELAKLSCTGGRLGAGKLGPLSQRADSGLFSGP